MNQPKKKYVKFPANRIHTAYHSEDNKIERPNLTKLLDTSLHVICTFDVSGLFLYVNSACKSVWGYRQDELIGKNQMDFIYSEDHKKTKLATAKILSGKNRAELENRFVHKNGSLVPSSWSLNWDESGQIWYAVAEDITEKIRKEIALQESEEIYKNIFDNNPMPMFIWDLKTFQFLDCNEATLLKYGYTKNEFLQLSIKDIRPATDIQLFEEAVKANQKNDVAQGIILRHQKKNGEIMFMKIKRNVINYKGRNASLVLLNDITKKIQADELREFERRDKEALINSTDDLIWSVSADFRLIAANLAFTNAIKEMTGVIIHPGQYLLRADIFPDIFLSFWKKCYEEVLSGKTLKKEVFTPATKQRKESWADIRFNPIYINGTVNSIACYSRNITDMKIAEEKIRTSEARLAEAQTVAKIGSWETDLVNLKVIWSKETYRIFEIHSDKFATNHPGFLEFVHPDDRTMVDNAFLASLEKHSINTIQHRIITPAGKIKFVEEHWHIQRDSENLPTRAVGTCQDITDRKIAEQQIKESELNYRTLVEQATDAICIADKSMKIIDINPYACEILGYSKEELLGTSVVDLFPADDLAINPFKIQELQSGLILRNDRKLKRKDQTIVEVEASSRIIEDGRFVVFARDITERKRADDEIQKLSIIAKETVNAVILTDSDEKILWVNEAFTQITEFEAAEVIGKRPGDFLQGRETNPAVVRFMRQKIKNIEPFECDIINYSKSGKKYWLRIQCQPQYDEAGKLKYFFAIQTDITKEKEAEERLKASEESYRYLFNNNPACIFIWDIESLQILEVNKTALVQYGYTKEEFLSKTILEQGIPKHADKIMKFVEQVRKNSGFQSTNVSKHLNKSGEVMYMSISSHRIQYKGKTVILALATNVTEKIFLERLLEEERLKKQKEITSAVISAQEAERQEIGRELHDNINQILASSLLYLNMVKSESDSKLSTHLEETDNLINTAITEIRNLSHIMISPSLNESELVQALEHLIRITTKPGGAAVNLIVLDFNEDSITDKHKLSIYRIVQEQLTNISKHAQASKVVVFLHQDNEKLILSIKDDGIGFDTRKKATGVGLMNIRTRASLFGGELIINSSPGKGTEIKVVFKLTCYETN